MSTAASYNKLISMSETDSIAITESVQIPASELAYRFSPSRGPGGQHANRVHTRVTLLFDIAGSPSLDEETKLQLLNTLASRVDKQGKLQISAQDTRSQTQNRELVTSRFVTLLSEALETAAERIATKPSKSADAKRLEEKRQQGKRKEERSRDWSLDQ